MALSAMAMGMMMMAVAVLIAGLVLESLMLMIIRSMGSSPNQPTLDQAGTPVVIHLRNSENTTGMAELLEEAA